MVKVGNLSAAKIVIADEEDYRGRRNHFAEILQKSELISSAHPAGGSI